MNMNRRPIIAIIGGASEKQDPTIYVLAQEIGRRLIDEGCRLVTGGLSGIMRASSKGARSSAAYNDGMIIGIVPSYDRSTANEFVDIVIATGMQMGRNALVVATADVVIAIGGGAGTLSEMALAWQINKPIIAMKSCEGWSHKLAGQCLDSRSDVEIMKANTAQEAVAFALELTGQKRSEPGEINSKWREP
jgi:uncharacterized protein (TIGR00725 family)